MRGKAITTTQVKEIRALRAQHYTYREISEMLSIGLWSVSKYVSERNLKKAIEDDKKRYHRNINGRKEKQHANYIRRRDKKRAAQVGPFYVVERKKVLRSEFKGWIEAHTIRSKKRGATWVRVSYHPDDKRRMIFEAWYERPEDQGPIRWKDAA